MMGRKEKLEYKLKKTNGNHLSSKTLNKIKNYTAHFDIGFSPLKPLDQEKARKSAFYADEWFEQDMINSDMALWRRKTPQKNGFL